MPMITCPDCAKEMSNSAPACPNCGRPNASAPPVAPAKRPVSILLGIGILLIPIIFSWFTLRSGHSVLSRIVSFSWLALSLALVNAGDGARTSSSTTSAPAQKAQTEQVMQVNIGEILSAYENNEVGADNKYKGRLIEVTGIIDDIKKDFMDNLYITLGTGRQFEIPQIQAFFDDSMNNQLGQLNKGERLTIVCRVDGLMMNVLAKKCVIK